MHFFNGLLTSICHSAYTPKHPDCAYRHSGNAFGHEKQEEGHPMRTAQTIRNSLQAWSFEDYGNGFHRPKVDCNKRSSFVSDSGDALLRFYPILAEGLGSAMAARLHVTIGEHDAKPASITGLLTFLESLAERARREWWLRIDNSYVNREMGPAREDYIQILKRRFDDADALFQSVLSLAEELEHGRAKDTTSMQIPPLKTAASAAR
ncbi:MAG: hypothetical protein IPI58_05745 [Alphaproteobacteria bacterium]|nr:MAG: hypothetical protein IPI58_05745 [Alphaproteobacteria bacterium]